MVARFLASFSGLIRGFWRICSLPTPASTRRTMPKFPVPSLVIWLFLLGASVSAASEWESTSTTAQISDGGKALMLDCSTDVLVVRLTVARELLGFLADEDEVELTFVADQGTPRQQSVSVPSDSVDRRSPGEVAYLVTSEKAKALAELGMRALDSIGVQVSHDDGVVQSRVDLMVATANRAAPAMLAVIDNCKDKPEAPTATASPPQPTSGEGTVQDPTEDNSPGAETRWRVEAVAEGEVEAMVAAADGHSMLGMSCTHGMFSLFYRVRRDQLDAADQSAHALSMFIVGADGKPSFAATRARTDDEEGFLRFEPVEGVSREQMIAWADLLGTGEVIKSGLARPGEGLEATVVSAEFGMDELADAEGTVRGVCDAYIFGKPGSGAWSVYQADINTPAMGISEGSATFALEAWGCDITYIAYRLPAAEVHPSLLNKTVGFTFGRDGEDWESILYDLNTKTEGDELVFSYPLSRDGELLDYVAGASRTVNIGLTGDNDPNRPPLTLTRFSAKGSTAAVAELRKQCR